MEKVLQLFAPPPATTLYNGKKWGELTFVERVMSHDWTKELVIVGILLGYIALYYVGVKANQRKVDKWVEQHEPVLDTQFASVGVKLPDAHKIVSDSATDFTTYASGRENVEHLLGRFRLRARQNLVTMGMETVLGLFWPLFDTKDTIDIVIKPFPQVKIDPVIFAVVNKADMRRLRDDNYYLSLSRTVDDTARLPPYLTFMTEGAEVTNVMFFDDLKEAVQDSQDVLEHISITDQDVVQPKELDDVTPQPIIRLGLKFPKNDRDVEVSKKIVNAAVEWVDHAAQKAHWRPEVMKKIKQTRDAETKKVQKMIDDKKAEERAVKKAEEEREKRKAQSKLSAAEQRKIEQKEREKEQKRRLNKQSKRGTVRA